MTFFTKTYFRKTVISRLPSLRLSPNLFLICQTHSIEYKIILNFQKKKILKNRNFLRGGRRLGPRPMGMKRSPEEGEAEAEGWAECGEEAQWKEEAEWVEAEEEA
jgi:hypothetical protein